MGRPISESLEWDDRLIETLEGYVATDTIESAIVKSAGAADRHRVWIRTRSGQSYALRDMYDTDERARREAQDLMRRLYRNPK